MSYFKLICEDEAIPFGGATTLIQEFQTEDLNIILGNMTKFLQKSGYLDGNKYLTFAREVDLGDIEKDLDEYTERLFTGTPITSETTVGVLYPYNDYLRDGSVDK